MEEYERNLEKFVDSIKRKVARECALIAREQREVFKSSADGQYDLDRADGANWVSECIEKRFNLK